MIGALSLILRLARATGASTAPFLRARRRAIVTRVRLWPLCARLDARPRRVDGCPVAGTGTWAERFLRMVDRSSRFLVAGGSPNGADTVSYV